MRPLRLAPSFRERPWGVRSLAPWFAAADAREPIGEAWFTANDNRLDDGTTLGDAIARHGEALLGTTRRGDLCPLLLKFLFTSERLSVQVHPDDTYAAAHHDGSLGKTEAWHVLRAEPGADVGLGFTAPLSPSRAREAATTGEIEHLLAWMPARQGDTFLVPAGTVHAIGAGLTIVEIQEHSDVTYRLYDYGRPRELHLEHGFTVATLAPYAVSNAARELAPGRTLLATCPYFTIERWEAGGTWTCTGAHPVYHLLVVIDGDGRVGDVPTRAGDVWIVPAASDPFELDARRATVLVSYTSESPTTAFRRR